MSRPHSTRRALSTARTHLQKRAVKVLAWVVFGYHVLKLLRDLRQALNSLEHVGWRWPVSAVAIARLSETVYVLSWRSIVDAGDLLERDGRGRRTGSRALGLSSEAVCCCPAARLRASAWVPGSFATSSMPSHTIAQRQFNPSCLTTAFDALALIGFGAGLATGLFAGTRNVLPTLLPAGVAAVGGGVAVLIARRSITQIYRCANYAHWWRRRG